MRLAEDCFGCSPTKFSPSCLAFVCVIFHISLCEILLFDCYSIVRLLLVCTGGGERHRSFH